MSVLTCIREVFNGCFRGRDPELVEEEFEMKSELPPELPPRNRPTRTRQERVEERRLNFYRRLRGRTTRRQQRIRRITEMELRSFPFLEDIQEEFVM